MATTSSNLTADTASSGQDNNGQGGKGRATGLLATAALGLALLGGLAFGQVQREAQAAATTLRSAPIPVAAQFVPDQFTYREDYAAPRIDGEDCLLGAPVPCGFQRGGPPAPTHGRGPADEYTQGDSATGHGTSSAWAVSDGTRPGFLDMGPGALAFVADPFTYREDHR